MCFSEHFYTQHILTELKMIFHVAQFLTYSHLYPARQIIAISNSAVMSHVKTSYAYCLLNLEHFSLDILRGYKSVCSPSYLAPKLVGFCPLCVLHNCTAL
jgi:hypothetical protein